MADPEPVAQFRVSMIRRARLDRAGETHSVLLLDVGLCGVFAEWKAEPLPIDERVRISFRLPENENPVVAECRVAWWHAAGTTPQSLPAGAGLEFVEISESDRARLQSLIEEHAKRDPRARQFTRWWPEVKAARENS